MSSAQIIPFSGLAVGPDTAPVQYKAPRPFRKYMPGDFIAGVSVPVLNDIVPNLPISFSPAQFSGADIIVFNSIYVEGAFFPATWVPGNDDVGKSVFIKSVGANCAGSSQLTSAVGYVGTQNYTLDLENPLSTLAKFVPVNASLSIVGGRLRMQSSQAIQHFGAYLSGLGQSADGMIEAEIDTAEFANNGDIAGVFYRTNGSALNSAAEQGVPYHSQTLYGYKVTLSKSGLIRLICADGTPQVSGTVRDLGRFQLSSMPSSVVLRAEFVGSTHKIYCNTFLVLQAIDSRIKTPGHMGFLGYTSQISGPPSGDENCIFVKNLRAQALFSTQWLKYTPGTTVYKHASYLGTGLLFNKNTSITVDTQKLLLNRTIDVYNAHIRVDKIIPVGRGVDFSFDLYLGMSSSVLNYFYAGSTLTLEQLDDPGVANQYRSLSEYLGGVCITFERGGYLVEKMNIQSGNVQIASIDLRELSDSTGQDETAGVYRVRLKMYLGRLRVYFNEKIAYNGLCINAQAASNFGLGYYRQGAGLFGESRVYDNIAWREIIKPEDFPSPGEEPI